jgi:hypothetical protein
VQLLRDAIAQGMPPAVLHGDDLLLPLRGYAPFEELLRPRG